jgi:hypothetical protein
MILRKQNKASKSMYGRSGTAYRLIKAFHEDHVWKRDDKITLLYNQRCWLLVLQGCRKSPQRQGKQREHISQVQSG